MHLLISSGSHSHSLLGVYQKIQEVILERRSDRLSEELRKGIKERAVEGDYRPEGSNHQGRPMLRKIRAEESIRKWGDLSLVGDDG